MPLLLIDTIFITMGSILFIISLLSMLKNSEINKFISGMVVPFLIFLIFILIGSGFLIGRFLYKRNKEARCSMLVNARCIGYDSQRFHHDGGTYSLLHAPIFNYSCYGREYNTKLSTYSSKTPQVGSYHDIYINPNNPQEIYKPSRTLQMIFLILGYSFFIIGFIYGMVSFLMLPFI